MDSSLGSLFEARLKAVNIGLPLFGESLEKQGIEVVYVEWRPPAGGDLELLALLDGLKQGDGRSCADEG
jgi:hypothetical protein